MDQTELTLMDQQQGLLDLLNRAHPRWLDTSKLDMDEAERLGSLLVLLQRDINWYIGDLARYTEAKWPDTQHQCYPPSTSPGLLARNAGVCRAYPDGKADRTHEATHSQYRLVAGKPDRQKRLEEMTGETTDESRQKGTLSPSNSEPGKDRWLLAVDVNYFLHRFWHSGAGIEAANQVAGWLERTVERLRALGLSDVACCFDSPQSRRKELTEGWEDKYKDRPKKDVELVQQLSLVRELLAKAGFACCNVDGWEADDVMASYAAQFDGRVTLLTQDKDQRQCLGGQVNILLDVEWTEDETSGDMLPEYRWLTAKDHTEETGIKPDQWTDFQAIMGDNVDGIRGVEGIGKKGAATLIEEFGTIEEVIEQTKRQHREVEAGELTEKQASTTKKKREAIIAFEEKLEVTRQLVTLRTDLEIPNTTRI